jgi:hypothetical protein
VKNIEDDIHTAEVELAIEGGGLMQHVLDKNVLRAIAFDPANAATGDVRRKRYTCSLSHATVQVSGTASGGCEYFITAERSDVHVLHIHSGYLKHVFPGSDKSVDEEHRMGHVSVITCLFFEAGRVYRWELS